MLLIQKVDLTWGKKERGAAGERVRRQFPKAYLSEKQRLSGEIAVHSLHFIQEGETFINTIQRIQQPFRKQQYQSYRSVQDLNLTNLSVKQIEDTFEITFFYDERRSGAPVRRGRNKDFWDSDSPFYRRDILNETAFVLPPSQYGRVIWNERNVDMDTGDWYYQLHIYNLFHLIDNHFTNEIFIQREPDVGYQQMGKLY